jgi:hypothetical protein
MWRVTVPNHLKVAVTRFARADADSVFAAMRAMAGDPLSGEVYGLGKDSYYRVVEGYLIFFDLIRDRHVVEVTAIERPH